MANNVVSLPQRPQSQLARFNNAYEAQDSVPVKADELSGATSTKDATMSEPTREEIDAKIAAVDARVETRFMELSGKIDRLADAVTRANADSIKASDGLRLEMQSVKADNRFSRIAIITAVVGSVLAGLAAMWVTQGNMLASFQAGLASRGDATVDANPRSRDGVTQPH
jgi:hypothetical protein